MREAPVGPRRMQREFRICTELPVPPERVWSAFSLAAANAELRPRYRLSASAEWLARPLREWPGHAPLPVSWVLLFGVIPVDRHRFGSLSLPSLTAFVETSTSWWNRSWRHARTLRATAAGCEVEDRVSFEPRLALFGALQHALYASAFRLRHDNLKRRYAVG